MVVRRSASACGGLGASVAQDLRALRLWQSSPSRQWHAVPWSLGTKLAASTVNEMLTVYTIYRTEHLNR